MNDARRLDAVDALRALAIIFMILCHFPIFLSSGLSPNNFLHFFSNHIIGDFAAPTFLVLVGISQALVSKRKSSQQIFFRGITIFFCGMALSALLHESVNAFDWDILPLIGFSICILLLGRHYNNSILLIVAFIVIAVAPYLRQYSSYIHYWGGGLMHVPFLTKFGAYKEILLDPVNDYTPLWNGASVLQGFLLNGYFPVFPWLSFPLIGFVIGKKIIKCTMANSLLVIFNFSAVAIILSFSLAIINLFFLHHSPLTSHLAPLSFYPDSTTMLLLQLGVVFAVFTLFWRLFEQRRGGQYLSCDLIWVKYFRLISRYSLTIYVMHLTLIFGGVKIAEVVNDNPGVYYENVCSTPTAFICGVIFLILIYPLLRYWSACGGKYSLEWLLQKA